MSLYHNFGHVACRDEIVLIVYDFYKQSRVYTAQLVYLDK